jgi:3-deoxy-7-phosphoheptulonate synthase
LFASCANFPIGLKNGRDGNVTNAINSVYVAQQPGTLYLDRQEINTKGNPYAHLILRGSISGQNYDKKTINNATKLMNKLHIKHPALIIDASHDNCLVKGKKKFLQQINVVKEMIQYMRINKKHNIKGLMIESFLKAGSQDVAELSKKTVDRGGLSITDPCLSFEDTEKLIYKLAYEL